MGQQEALIVKGCVHPQVAYPSQIATSAPCIIDASHTCQPDNIFKSFHAWLIRVVAWALNRSLSSWSTLGLKPAISRTTFTLPVRCRVLR
jgi:hypothetical protein